MTWHCVYCLTNDKSTQNIVVYIILCILVCVTVLCYWWLDVPTDYVEALDSPWFRSSHQNSTSESSSEFEEDENKLLHEQLISPDVEGVDGEDRHQVAHEKRMWVPMVMLRECVSPTPFYVQVCDKRTDKIRERLCGETVLLYWGVSM